MLKLKNQAILFSNHGMLRFFSASTAAAAISDAIPQPQQSTLDSNAQMKDMMDPDFFISTLFKCRNIFQIKQVHAQVTTTGIIHDLIVANKLLYICAKHKDLTFRELIRGGSKPDNFSLPFVIKACRDTMGLIMGRLIHSTMRRDGFVPDKVAMVTIVNACAKLGAMNKARLVHDYDGTKECDFVERDDWGLWVPWTRQGSS
ncbi:hypothetical protein D5086_029266 [Populus alba]|uniref:Uncharacterized protein n=1 Tax=Populus alba TaxID=43335 RepID=A0ACC4ATV1_POPAL